MTSRIETRRDELLEEMRALADNDLEGADLELFERLESEVDKLNKRIKVLHTAQAGGQGAVESGEDTSVRDINRSVGYMRRDNPFETPTHRESPTEIHSRALTAVEEWRAADEVKEAAVHTLEGGYQRSQLDISGIAEHALLTSNPDYIRAFNKHIADPEGFRDVLEPEERAAWKRVREMQKRTTLDLSGAVVPAPLDPSFIVTNTGAIDPMRQVARLDQTTSKDKRYITTAGVTASFDAEGAEVSDDTPTLTEVTVTTRKAQAFVAATIEASEDIVDFESEIGKLLADAKTRLEAPAFVNGTSGSNEPNGIVTRLAGSASEINVATSETFAAADVYTVSETLNPRWRANATWMAELSTLNAIDQFETGNGAKLFPELGGANPMILRRPVAENSSVDAYSDVNVGATANNYIIIYGDFNQYVILDRVGATVSYIPHLFNTNANRPDGTRGWYMYWRTGGDRLTTNAFVLLDLPTTA